MVQSSFAERLQRIEQVQTNPVKDRMLVGISEAALTQSAEAKKKRKAKKSAGASKPGKSMIFKAAIGFALLYGGMMIATHMNDIRTWLDSEVALAPYRPQVMMGVGALVILLLVFFAFKLQRAAFRVMTEPWRLPFALGMVLGLALGFGPPEFSSDVFAQLQ